METKQNEVKGRPQPTLPLASRELGDRSRRAGRSRGGAEEQTYTLWFKGCGALAIERQEPSHFLPEAADKTDGQAVPAGGAPTHSPPQSSSGESSGSCHYPPTFPTGECDQHLSPLLSTHLSPDPQHYPQASKMPSSVVPGQPTPESAGGRRTIHNTLYVDLANNSQALLL